MNSFNKNLQNQISELQRILMLNTELYNTIKQAQNIGLQNYYIGAGCISQTVWNYQMGFDLLNGISDIDFVYYDDLDLSSDAENKIKERLTSTIPQGKIGLDVVNEARVHLWYKEEFGRDIKPYTSVENAINTWPTTATSIGVRLENHELKVYAPYGLNDLFGMILRPNKVQITEEIYMKKVNKWTAKWSSLKVVAW